MKIHTLIALHEHQHIALIRYNLVMAMLNHL